MDVIPLPEWNDILHEIFQRGSIIVIIGSTDSGKSCLARYLIDRLLSTKRKVSIVDSDIGQSTIGLPGTISMKSYLGELNISEDILLNRMIFVGFINPAKDIRLVVNSTAILVNSIRNTSGFIIVDTSGLISGIYGKILKIEKIKKINPDYIIGIQKNNELEHIIGSLDNVKGKVFVIPPSPQLRIRSRIERINYRIKKFKDYFSNKKNNEFVIYKSSMQFYYYGRQVDIERIKISKNTLIGLNDSEYTISLGIISDVTKNSIAFYSPIDSIKSIDRIIIGDIRFRDEEFNINNISYYIKYNNSSII